MDNIKRGPKLAADVKRMKKGKVQPTEKLVPSKQESAPKKHTSTKTVMPHGHGS